MANVTQTEPTDVFVGVGGVAYRILESHFEEIDGKQIRVIDKAEVIGFSVSEEQYWNMTPNELNEKINGVER